MGDHVDVRVLDGRQRATHQLLGRLATPRVDAGDDEVEPSEQLVRIVQGCIGADLELGAVQDAERRKLAVQASDLGALLLDLLGNEPARDAE